MTVELQYRVSDGDGEILIVQQLANYLEALKFVKNFYGGKLSFHYLPPEGELRAADRVVDAEGEQVACILLNKGALN